MPPAVLSITILLNWQIHLGENWPLSHINYPMHKHGIMPNLFKFSFMSFNIVSTFSLKGFMHLLLGLFLYTLHSLLVLLMISYLETEHILWNKVSQRVLFVVKFLAKNICWVGCICRRMKCFILMTILQKWLVPIFLDCHQHQSLFLFGARDYAAPCLLQSERDVWDLGGRSKAGIIILGRSWQSDGVRLSGFDRHGSFADLFTTPHIAFSLWYPNAWNFLGFSISSGFSPVPELHFLLRPSLP